MGQLSEVDIMEKRETAFYQGVVQIALLVTLQSLLQSSFSVMDQVMIGQLGSEKIAGIGLGGKFASIYSVVLGAIAGAAGVMMAQYLGQKNQKDLQKSFWINLLGSLCLALLFTTVCLLFSREIMQIYTKDTETSPLAAEYLQTYCLSFFPMALISISAVLLRCIGAAVYPLLASILAVFINTGLNYILIFGKYGVPALGVKGAAWASVISQWAACVMTLLFLIRERRKQAISLKFDWKLETEKRRVYFQILAPILFCEFFWSMGENVYGILYGNLGTQSCAAMTMTGPIQALMMGALSGLSQAAGILVGKSLGKGAYEKAYEESKKFMGLGFIGSLLFSILLVCFGTYYVEFYQVPQEVQRMSYQILVVFALISPAKVQNMILGGGIIRSGGMTKYVMWIDIIGTWGVGVPLGLLAGFVWKLPILWVYFLLSLEELLRWGISLWIFQTKRWMKRL
ncbi:MAG: MATE family efflux transporter [Lachnospiraceae bacterium]|nr:MATE family efflux transporter [Lachnospiraceae bacterium]